MLLILTGSSILNAAYFLPILYTAWFKTPDTEAWTDHHPNGRFETKLSLLTPAVLMGLLVLGVGLLANTVVSPLEWAKLIAEREYTP